jgi:phospholipase/carboxylesterase
MEQVEQIEAHLRVHRVGDLGTVQRDLQDVRLWLRPLQRLVGLGHDELWDRTGIEPSRTVFGGFSMGSVMSYAMGLGADRPEVAGILAFSGFIPTVEGWTPDLAARRQTRVFIAHGRNDPVMDVAFAQRANELLVAAGLDVEYHESDAGHQIDPAHVPAALNWLEATLAPLGERL